MQRRLAAVLCTDIVGYSRLMGADEVGTLTALKAHRTAIETVIADHDGRVVKSTGDGLLVEFPSVVAAVAAAVAIQTLMTERGATEPEERRQRLRIGIHLGDVIAADDDIYGDGVNIAARLQEQAEPGGIALSRIVADSVRGKIDATLVDAGERALKNIATQVQVFRIAPPGGSTASVRAGSGAPLPLPDKPSIAVLPFANMSRDPEQEYFADGITEDIITELSRFRSLFVIARNSSFTYKGRAVDLKQVGRELGVRYVLEGSVRKAAERLRITGQLIDATTGAHLWAERYDGTLEDVFDLQDRITGRVVSALMANLEQAEIERARRKPTASLEAYDYCLRAKAAISHISPATIAEALDLLGRAIESDPNYAAAYGLAARCHGLRTAFGWVDDRAMAAGEAERLARRAAALAPDDAVILGMTGFTLAYLVHDLEAAIGSVSRALAMSPNYAPNWGYSAWIRLWCGEPRAALEHVQNALRLNPLDPGIVITRDALAHSHYFLDEFDAAAAVARESLQSGPDNAPTLRIGTAALAMAGRLEEAVALRMRLQVIDPGLTLANLTSRQGPYRRAEDIARYAEGLRRAGLPE